MSLHLLDFHNLWYLVETSRKTPRPACHFELLVERILNSTAGTAR